MTKTNFNLLINKDNAAKSTAALLFAGMVFSPMAVAEEAPKVDETITVTASGTKRLYTDAPASVTIIDSEEVKSLPIKDLGDVLRGVAGVSISNFLGGRNSINLRGLDEDYVLLLVNGKRVSSSNGIWRAGNFDNTSIPLDFIERVEVVRGPMSALYGSDAVGGVINIITRQPQEDWYTSLSGEYSMMNKDESVGGDRYRTNFFSSGQLNDGLGLVFSAEKSYQDAWVNREVTPVGDTIEERETLKFATTLSWQIDEQQTLDIDLGNDQDDVPLTNYGGADREQSIDRTTFGLTHIGDWNWGSTQLLFNRADAELYDYNSRYTLQPPLGRDIDEIQTTFRGSAIFNLDSQLLTVGAEYLDTEVKDPVQYPSTGGDSLSLSSVFIQDEIDVTDSLIATLGVRVEDSEEYGTHTSPRAYLVYSVSDDITLKGGVGTAFRAPTIFESSPLFRSVSCRGACALSGNPDLKEETSVNTELSLMIAKDTWETSITIFNNDVEDLITVEGWDGTAPLRSYYNEAEVKIQGLELITLARFTDNTSLEFNYTHLDTEDTDGEELSYRPSNVANLKFNWRVIDSVGVYGRYNYYGDHVGNRKQELDSYSQIDIGSFYDVTDDFRVKVGATNLTDEQPVLDNPTSDMVLQGRAYFVGFNYKF